MHAFLSANTYLNSACKKYSSKGITNMMFIPRSKPQNYFLYQRSCVGKETTALHYILIQHWPLQANARKFLFQTRNTGMFMAITSFVRGAKPRDSKEKVLTSQDCLTGSGRLYSSILSLLHYERHQTQRGTQAVEVDVAEQRKDYL